MLQRLIGADIDVQTALAPGLRRVRADPNQMAQVLMNLAVNARDAMPESGRLTISTESLSGDDTTAIDVAAVRLSVADTGVGMDDAVKKRIFEPFFTTSRSARAAAWAWPRYTTSSSSRAERSR